MNYLVRDREVIFNLAGQVSHIDSMRDPYTDLEINCRSQLTLLEACRNHNPSVKVVFAGTRQVYGRPDSLPVSEAHLVRPTDINGINKAAGEYYHLVYNNVFGVRACSLRLTNVYGPRQLIKHNRQGFIGWFIRLAIEGQADPDLRRRFAAPRLRLRGRRGRRVSARRRQRRRATARCSTSAATSRSATVISPPSWCGLPAPAASSTSSWPPDKKVIDIGSFYADSTRFMKATGWKPAVSLADGLTRTDRFLPPALLPVRRRRAAGARVIGRAFPFLSLAPREAMPRGSCARPIDRVISRRLVRARPGGGSVRSGIRRGDAARPHAVGVGTGTDAIALILRALGIGPGDEVITTPLSAAYTALAVMMVGARPVFADIDPSRLTLDPEQVAQGDHAAHARDPPRAPVRPAGRHGGPRAARGAPQPRARRGLLPGASGDGRRDGRSARSASPARSASTRRRISARSATAAPSSPTTRRSPIGSGACATAARAIATVTTTFGVNSRLDEMQAAILRARLPRLAGWTARRRALAAALPIGARRRSGGRSDGARCRARVPSVRRAGPRPRRAAGATRRRRHRNARPLSGSDPAPAGAGRREPSRLSRGGARLRRGAVAAAPSGPDRR